MCALASDKSIFLLVIYLLRLLWLYFNSFVWVLRSLLFARFNRGGRRGCRRVGQSGGVVALGEARTVPRTKHKATPLALPAPAAAIATTAAADAGASPVAGGWGGGGDGGGGGGGLPFVARDHIGELRAKLTQHGLEAYLERCLAEGFDDLHFLKTMPREEAAF